MVDSPSTLSPATEQPLFSPVEISSPRPWLLLGLPSYLRDHMVAAAVAFLFTLLVGGYLLFEHSRPVYKAESIVYVSPYSSSVVEQTEHDRLYDDFFEQQIFAVTRPENLMQAIEANRQFALLPGETEASAVMRLQKTLKVEQMGHSYQMSINLLSPKRNGLAEFINSLTSGYIAESLHDEFYDRDKHLEILHRRSEELQHEANEDLRKQDDLLASLGMVQGEETGDNQPYAAALKSLREQLEEAHAKRDEADASASAESEASTGSPTLGSGSAAEVPDPGTVAMKTQLNTRRAALMLQMNGLTPQNPLYLQSQAELNDIDQQLERVEREDSENHSKKVRQTLDAERERARRLEQSLNDDLRRSQSIFTGNAHKLDEAEQLSAEIARLQANSILIKNRIDSLVLESGASGSEHVVSPATPPAAPAPRHLPLYVGALLIAAAILAMATAFLLEMLDPKLYHAAQVRTLLGFPPIGLLLREEDFPKDFRTEHVLRLTAGIDQAHRRSGVRTLLFTSAGMGDSHAVVQDVGSKLAASGLKVLVILVASRLEGSEGVSRVSLADSARLRIQGAKPTGLLPVNNSLDLTTDLEAAKNDYRVTEVLAQDVADFLRRSRSAYDLMLIGATPLLVSAYTEHLARVVDGTLVLAESGSITKRQLIRAARILERLKTAGIALVLSDISLKWADSEIRTNAAEYASRPARPVDLAPSARPVRSILPEDLVKHA